MVHRIEDSLLDALDADFPEVAKLPPLAEAMVELEHTFDHMKRLASNGWKALDDHPDLDPAHEALLLYEHFTEMLRLESVANEPSEFRSLLEDSKLDSQKLEALLRASEKTLEVDATFQRVSKNCTTCHKQFRDVPLAR